MHFPWLRVLVLCLMPLVTVASGCSGCEEKKLQVQPVVDLPEVPAPAHHVADLFVPKPEEAYLNLRNRLGGPLALLPATFPSAVVIMTGLSPQLLDQVDGKSPALGVLTDDGDRFVFTLGIHVRDSARTIQLLTEGADAKYKATPPQQGVVILEPRPTLTSRVATFAIAGNYLLSAEKPEDLLACAPYIAGTLTKRPSPKGEIVLQTTKSALSGPVTKRIRSTWNNFREEKEKEDQELRKQKGRNPDFGEPAAAIADVQGRIDGIISVLSDLQRAELTIDTNEAGVRMALTMSPADGDGYASKEFSSLLTGDLAPLLAMPQDTVLGLLIRHSPQDRKASAQKQAESLIKLLGERIKENDKKKVHDALASWAEGRGDWMAASLSWTQQEQQAILTGSVTDPAVLDTAIRSFFDLTSVPGFKEPLEHHLGKLKFSNVAKLGDGSIIHVKRDKEKQADNGKVTVSSAFDLAWQVNPDRFELRAGENAKQWLTDKKGIDLPTLAQEPLSSKVFEGIGNDAAFVLFVDPQRFLSTLLPRGATAKQPSAPLVLAYGGESKQGWFKIMLSHASARELIKLLGQK